MVERNSNMVASMWSRTCPKGSVLRCPSLTRLSALSRHSNINQLSKLGGQHIRVRTCCCGYLMWLPCFAFFGILNSAPRCHHNANGRLRKVLGLFYKSYSQGLEAKLDSFSLSSFFFLLFLLLLLLAARSLLKEGPAVLQTLEAYEGRVFKARQGT